MKKNLGMLALIMAFWFTISFITSISGTAYSGHYPQFQSERSCDGGVYPDFLLSGLRHYVHPCRTTDLTVSVKSLSCSVDS